MVRIVVMASGQATRMGQDKLALPWGKTTVLGHVLETIRKSIQELASILSDLVEVWVVARKPMSDYWDGKLDPGAGHLKWVWINEPKPHPLSVTIRRGLADLPQEIQGICFIPGDQVGLEALGLAELIASFVKNQPDFLIPQTSSSQEGTVKELKGSPVFFHRRYIEELRSLEGEQGGRMLLRRYPDRGRTFPVSAGFLVDVDTPEDYRRFAFEGRIFDNIQE